jgi:hypothetical protein
LPADHSFQHGAENSNNWDTLGIQNGSYAKARSSDLPASHPLRVVATSKGNYDKIFLILPEAHLITGTFNKALKSILYPRSDTRFQIRKSLRILTRKQLEILEIIQVCSMAPWENPPFDFIYVNTDRTAAVAKMVKIDAAGRFLMSTKLVSGEG